ncbi:MAG: FMN-binding protein [Acidobacteria bacterium]|nr:FMN-binding protein [Acidobacteriota bacterium]
MSHAAQPPKTAPVQIPASAMMIRVMGVVSLVCGLLIVITYQGTLQPIRRNQETILRESVAQLLPGVQKQIIYQVQPDGSVRILDDVQASVPKLFAGYNSSGALLGIVIETSERGYADVIKAMYVYSPEKQAIVDFKVIELKETPGLGDKITSDRDFLANFRNLEAKLDAAREKLLHAIVTVKHGTKKNPWEVDAISGATISSRAVGRMLDKSARQALPVIARNLGRIQRGE